MLEASRLLAVSACQRLDRLGRITLAQRQAQHLSVARRASASWIQNFCLLRMANACGRSAGARPRADYEAIRKATRGADAIYRYADGRPDNISALATAVTVFPSSLAVPSSST